MTTVDWYADKIFAMATRDGADMLTTNFEKLWADTLGNPEVIAAIVKISGLDIDVVTRRLTQKNAKKQFVIRKLESQFLADVILGYDIDIYHLDKIDDEIITKAQTLAIVNSRHHVWPQLASRLCAKDQHLMTAIAAGNHTIYQILMATGKWRRTLNLYYQAVASGSIEIVHDVASEVAPCVKLLEWGFQANYPDIIEWLIQEAVENRIDMPAWLWHYAFMNAQHLLIKKYVKNWHMEYYHSALLSGDLDVISEFETRYPDLHHDLGLDKAREARGQKSVILDDIMYRYRGKRRFSHTVNYAIQSKQVSVVKHVLKHGYGVTFSNIVTCIRQSNVATLDVLTNVYTSVLPTAALCYFDIRHAVPDRWAKIALLLRKGQLRLTPSDRPATISEIKHESAHREILSEITDMEWQQILSDTYVLWQMHAYLLPKSKPDSYLYHSQIKLRTRFMIALKFQITSQLEAILRVVHAAEAEMLAGILALEADFPLFQKLEPKISVLPNETVMSELVCRRQLAKICYYYQAGRINSDLAIRLATLGAVVEPELWNKFFTRQGYHNVTLSAAQIISTNNADWIYDWLSRNPNPDSIDFETWCRYFVTTPTYNADIWNKTSDKLSSKLKSWLQQRGFLVIS